MRARRHQPSLATARLAALIGDVRLPDLPLRRGGVVVAADGAIVEALGLHGAIGDRVAIAGAAAEIIGFRDGRALLMGLAPLAGITPGTQVLPDAQGSAIPVGDALLGRVIDGLGQPLDGLGPVAATTLVPASPPPLPPQARARVTRPLASGVRAIDALLSLGQGQRIGIMAGTGVGKSVLLGQITRWAQADVVVVALIGERSREISDFIETELAGPENALARHRTVTIAVPASDAMLCRVRGAQRAFAIAEWYRAQGRQVLLILDSLSRVVHGAREVAMARGEPAGARGFAPSSLQLIADLAERAGGDRASGGAITLVATVLAESDDRADPVVDAARGVMDGHVLLSRRLAGRGQFPAIDLVNSASRVMIDIAAPAHEAAARGFRRMVALAEENRDLVLMGAYAPGADPELDLALALQPALAAFMMQARDVRCDPADSIATLIELVAP